MKRIFIILSFVLGFTSSFSQTYQIGAIPRLPNLGLPDTVYLGDTVNFSIYVKNFGSNTYFGTFFVNLAIDSGNGLNYVGMLDSVTMQINANDTIPFNYLDSIPSGPSPLRIGGNIIVIWPAAINFQAFDSAWASVFVMSSSSIGEIVDKNNIKVYPNPTSDEIMMLEGKNNISVVRVRIFDKTGKEIAVINNSSVIDLRVFASGTYIAEAEFADKTKFSFKIIKR